jgi:hypothetical protein
MGISGLCGSKEGLSVSANWVNVGGAEVMVGGINVNSGWGLTGEITSVWRVILSSVGVDGSCDDKQLTKNRPKMIRTKPIKANRR